MRIVLIGGAGYVGRLIGPSLAEFAEVVVADRAIARDIEWGRPELADVTDRASLRRVLVGADVVVYLVMGTKEDWGTERWAESQFGANVFGLYNTLEAAHESGVSHAIIAGSMSVFHDFMNASPEDHPDATDAYGLSKKLGEEIAQAAVVRNGLDATILRLVLPMDDETWHACADDKHAAVMTSGTDTAAAFVAAVRKRQAGLQVFAVSGDLTSEIVDWTATQQHLGWRPTSQRIETGR